VGNGRSVLVGRGSIGVFVDIGSAGVTVGEAMGETMLDGMADGVARASEAGRFGAVEQAIRAIAVSNMTNRNGFIGFRGDSPDVLTLALRIVPPNVGISRWRADPERSEGEAKPVGCMPCWVRTFRRSQDFDTS
jgi:hypothetical protein